MDENAVFWKRLCQSDEYVWEEDVVCVLYVCEETEMD